jgi:hypothetical protein
MTSTLSEQKTLLLDLKEKILQLQLQPVDFTETRKILVKVDLINRFKKYHVLLVNVKKVVDDLKISDEMDIKDALLLLLESVDLQEFSSEIKDFVLESRENIKKRGKLLLLQELDRVGWYKGELGEIGSREILELMINVKGMVVEGLMQGPREEFKWNFSGDKKTNRRDKPEWIFKFVFRILEKVEIWVKETFSLDIWAEFVRVWLQEVQKKLGKEIKKMDSKQIIHMVKEITEFDSKLYQKFQIKEFLLGRVLQDSKEILVQVLLKESLSRFRGWMLEKDAFTIDVENEVRCCTNLIGLICVMQGKYCKLNRIRGLFRVFKGRAKGIFYKRNIYSSFRCLQGYFTSKSWRQTF